MICFEDILRVYYVAEKISDLHKTFVFGMTLVHALICPNAISATFPVVHIAPFLIMSVSGFIGLEGRTVAGGR
jgi:hypothetical protein